MSAFLDYYNNDTVFKKNVRNHIVMGANNEKTLVFLMSTKLNFEKLYFCNKKYIEKL